MVGQLDTEVVNLDYIEKQVPKIPVYWSSVGRGRSCESCPVTQMVKLDVGPLADIETEENFVHIGEDWENEAGNVPTSDGVHLLINIVDIHHTDDQYVMTQWFIDAIAYIRELGFN